jgi:Protein of unknown function (DUF3106)
MKRFFQFASAVAALMLALSAAQAVRAAGFSPQRGQAPHAQARQGQPRANQGQNQPKKIQNRPAVRSMMGLPPKWMDKLRDLSPQEQERFMRNNARFQSLPPQRQEQIRRNLERWNQMTPEQRDAMRNREQILERMSPGEQQEVVKDLLPRWKNLRQDRREILNGRLRVLRGMTPNERQQALQDPQFMRGLDDNEQDLLRKITALRVGPGPGSQPQ